VSNRFFIPSREQVGNKNPLPNNDIYYENRLTEWQRLGLENYCHSVKLWSTKHRFVIANTNKAVLYIPVQVEISLTERQCVEERE